MLLALLPLTFAAEPAAEPHVATPRPAEPRALPEPAVDVPEWRPAPYVVPRRFFGCEVGHRPRRDFDAEIDASVRLVGMAATSAR